MFEVRLHPFGRSHDQNSLPHVQGTHLAPGARVIHPFPAQEALMAVAKVTEITAGSPKSFDDAIRTGITRASKTLDNIEGAWIKEQKIVCDGENIVEYRVTMKVTFVLKD
jgi:flavin-binding protein dodecin